MNDDFGHVDIIKLNNDYCVYIHRNMINNKRYVGLTHQKPNDRWHNGTNYYHNIHFKSAIKKYGWDNFEHVIYASGLSAEEASALEVELIAKYNTTNQNYGYNLDSGGSRTTHSEETKQKMSLAAKGRKISEETKEKLRIASTGNKNSLGYKHTEEAKQKNREAHIGKTHTLTEEAKRRISLHQKSRREILCVELDRIFVSVCEAARFVNGSQGTISSVLAGKRKTAYKYHWKYTDNNNIKV